MKILTDSDPILRLPSTPVTIFDEQLEQFCRDLVETMRQANGAGLAAPQVGHSKRIIVITNSEGDITVMVNPRITDHSTKLFTLSEGCLSIPGELCEVTRPFLCTVEYYTPQGSRGEVSLDFWASRVVQHEIDHLNGVLMTDERNYDC